jgi:thiamine-monophosphate kinase
MKSLFQTPDPALPPLGEFGLISWIRQRATTGDGVRLGIGDDCAVLRFSPGAEVLATTDMLMEGRHFRTGLANFSEVGYKALAVNLSDIAAMAGIPLAALVAVALPRDRAVAIAQGILAGMIPLAKEYEVSVVGGDTNAWDGPLVVSVTVLGEATPLGPIKRSGARAGDAILVTGRIGGSLLGRHLHPRPRVIEALSLQVATRLHAMIDISDGLAADLAHILEESGGLGATLDASAIPIHDDAEALSRRDGRAALDHALNDGEDFELCLVVDRDDAEWLVKRPPLLRRPTVWQVPRPGGGTAEDFDTANEPHPRVQLYRVGEITAEPGLRIRGTDGSITPVDAKGFDHFSSPSEGE